MFLLLPRVLAITCVDVGVELLQGRLLALVGEAGDLVYGLLHLVPYLLDVVLVDDVPLEKLVFELAYGVALAPLLDLVLGPVLLEEVRRPVRRGAVGDRLDRVRLAGLADLLRDPMGTLEDRFQVHPIDLLVLDAEGVELGGEVGHGRGACYARAHAVLVVLHDKEARTHAVPAPEPGQVGRLVERSPVHRPVPEVELADLVRLVVGQRVGYAHAYGDVPADDAPTPVEIPLDVEQVHRTALALDEAGLLAVELGHDRLRVAAQQQGKGVISVGCDDLVALFAGVEEAGGDRFLTNVDVEVAPDLALPETPLGGLLEDPDEDHLPVQVQEVIAVGGYRPLAASLYAPVPRMLVLCRHKQSPSIAELRFCRKNTRLRRFATHIYPVAGGVWNPTRSAPRAAFKARARWESSCLRSPSSA